MSIRVKVALLLLIFALSSGVVGLLALPTVVAALPGEVRLRLPPALLEIVTTPLPTALPTAVIAAEMPQVTIEAFSFPTNMPPATEPSPTPLPATATAASTLPPTFTPPPTPTATATPDPLPATVWIDGIKVVPQKFNNCGPANVAINLNFYGVEVTQFDTAAALKPNREDRNVSPWEIAAYVNEQTALRATVHSGGTLTVLKQLLASGFPVVIEKGYDPPTGEGWMGHYLTLVGYDENKQEFYGMDTFLGPWDSTGRTETYGTIETYWPHFNNTFYVVYRPQQEETVYEILGPDYLDPLTMWQQAARQSQAAIEANEEDAFAWFSLGTNLARLGALTGETELYENGAAAFDQARALGLPPRILWYQFQPYVAYLQAGRYQDVITLADITLTTQGGRNVEETYFYKGHALLALGEIDNAAAAYRRAVRVNKNFTLAQEALDMLDDS